MKAIIIFVLVSMAFIANASDAVPPMYTLVAKENKVPEKLFYALILNESRSLTSTPETSKVLPWPWTINHRGTPHYFPTIEEAYAFARSLVDAGDEQFDVGLGQLNWRWQKHRFTSLREAFDPYTNLSVAAKHLREQFKRPECSRWDLAVGCYHRPAQRSLDKQIAAGYTKRVISLWEKI
jgi:hypothetical protein